MQAFTASSRSRLRVECRKETGELRMSRIGAKPVPLPKGVTITIEDKLVKVKVGCGAH
jgi:hypothetical protein